MRLPSRSRFANLPPRFIAPGLGLRYDWGSQYRARQFRAEIKWLRHPLQRPGNAVPAGPVQV